MGIDKRHGIVPEDGDRLEDFYEKYDFCPPYTLRAKYWRQYCPKLAMTAVQKALKEWGGDKNLITHVVSHSTTGWDVPGWDVQPGTAHVCPCSAGELCGMSGRNLCHVCGVVDCQAGSQCS